MYTLITILYRIKIMNPGFFRSAKQNISFTLIEVEVGIWYKTIRVLRKTEEKVKRIELLYGRSLTSDESAVKPFRGGIRRKKNR